MKINKLGEKGDPSKVIKIQEKKKKKKKKKNNDNKKQQPTKTKTTNHKQNIKQY